MSESKETCKDTYTLHRPQSNSGWRGLDDIMTQLDTPNKGQQMKTFYELGTIAKGWRPYHETLCRQPNLTYQPVFMVTAIVGDTYHTTYQMADTLSTC